MPFLNSIFQMHDIVIMGQINLHARTQAQCNNSLSRRCTIFSIQMEYTISCFQHRHPDSNESLKKVIACHCGVIGRRKNLSLSRSVCVQMCIENPFFSKTKIYVLESVRCMCFFTLNFKYFLYSMLSAD